MTYRVKNAAVAIASEVVTSGTAKNPVHTFADRVHAIRADVAGTIEARLRGDLDFRTYTVDAGDVIFGEFTQARLGDFAVGQLLGLRLAVA